LQKEINKQKIKGEQNMIKVMKYQIIKPIDTDWEMLGNILYNLQKECRTIRNKTSQLCWEYQGFTSDYKEKHSEYPKSKEILGYSNMMGYAYDKLKYYNKGNSGNRSASIKDVTDKWRSDTKEILRGDKLPPTYKKDVPIDIANKSIIILKEDNNYYINASLLSNDFKKELGSNSGKILLLLSVKNNTQKVILDRILSGEYKASASQIKQIKKGKSKWMLYLSYSFKPETEDLSKENIMGIDMGIVYPVYMAFNNSLHRYKIKGGEIEHFRRQVESRRKSLLEQGKYCGKGRIGHGTLTRLKPIDKIGNKVTNFRDTTNHKYSKYIVDMAVKHKCGIIQMEDLSNINKDNIFLKNWTYYDLQQKIKYKAEEKGIETILINPRYTSQRCSKCGCIVKDNRETQSEFECVECGFKTNADYNAARNIAIPNIDDIINESLTNEITA